MLGVDAVTRISDLLDSLDPESVEAPSTIPASLRAAAAIAVEELGVAPSTSNLMTEALRARLEAVVMEAALEAEYTERPELRPRLAEVAIAAAELDGNPIAERPDLIRAAADAIVLRRPYADADDVLVWAEALASGAA